MKPLKLVEKGNSREPTKKECRNCDIFNTISHLDVEQYQSNHFFCGPHPGKPFDGVMCVPDPPLTKERQTERDGEQFISINVAISLL